jgi:hypothetical protein
MKLRDLLAWAFPAIQPLYIIKNKAPDTSGVNKAAEDAAALNREQLAWFKQTYEREQPLREETAALDRRVAESNIAGMDFAMQQARELDEYNKSTFRPLEQRIVADAQTYDTPERRASAAASAAADVDMASAANRQATERAMMRAGVTPGSAKALAIQEDAKLGATGMRAGAMTNASRNVEQQGYARTMDAASLGRGLPSQQATQQQISSQAGMGAVNAAGAGLNAATSGSGFMAQGYGQGMQGSQVAGNLFGQAFNAGRANNLDRLAFFNTNMGAARDIGTSMASLGISDKAKKKGTGKIADGRKATEAIEKTPVHDGWEYDPAKGGPDDGGKPHIGPMAQDVNANMGESAAPGGTSIDLVNMNGTMMAAVQDLAKRVKRMESKVA